MAADAIELPNAVVEACGKNIYTRKQRNEIIQQEVYSYRSKLL